MLWVVVVAQPHNIIKHNFLALPWVVGFDFKGPIDFLWVLSKRCFLKVLLNDVGKSHGKFFFSFIRYQAKAEADVVVA